jgi:hypothetical protein
MRISIFRLMAVLILYVSIFNQNCIAYNNIHTHRYINVKAVEKSKEFNAVLEEYIGFFKGKEEKIGDKEIWEWIREGGYEEDDPEWRCLRHFHDPLNTNWDDAGLLSLYKSMIYWTQTPDSGNDNDLYNEYSWILARGYYHKALLTGSEKQYAKTFRSLGQLMHLISDAAVPAHVRNDPHVPFLLDADLYEKWVEDFFSNSTEDDRALFISSDFTVDPAIFNKAVLNTSAPSPISALWDHDEYKSDGSNMPDDSNTTIGLAEYTNANFWTEDTFPWNLNSGNYPHRTIEETNYDEDVWLNPVPEVVEDGLTDNRIYFSKMSDTEGAPFLAVTYWTQYLYISNKPEYIHTFVLDEKCFEQYAKRLIPRAIGYSAALLDYFFRGTIEVTPPNDFVYSIIDGSATDQKFEHIKANLRNATLDEEEMVDGTLVAIARYKRIINYSPDLSVEIEPGQPKQPNEPLDPSSREGQYSYSVSAQDTSLLQTSAPTEITFDFTADPIPAGVTDLTLQVVFLGTLGNEVDTAVAVGMVDLTEPTHFTFFNSTDEIPNADGSALVPAANKGFPRDFIIAFTGMDPDADDGIENKTANFGFYESYDPLIVVEDLAPAAYFRIVALMDARQHAYLVMDSGDSAFCPPIWSFRESDGAVYQEDTSGDYVPGIQLKPTYCDTGQPFSHRGIWQHHTYYQYQCGETNCDYLLEQRSNVSETAIVSLSEKINFPNHVISYTPPTCAEPGGDLGKKMETRLCYP